MSIGKKIWRGVCIGLIVLSLLALIAFTAVCAYAKKNINYAFDDALFNLAQGESVIRLYAKQKGSDGTQTAVLFEEVYLSEYKKEHVALEDMSPCVREAFLAAEDRTFYQHRGVNVRRTLYAAWNTLTKQNPTFGASTITQQVVKNISGDSEVTLKRKFSEILRALHMERVHTKDEILSLYLNIVPMSENILGIGKAAEVYFGTDAGSLTYAQAATLAGIANAPTRYNPYTHPEACLEKRNRVLYAMWDAGYIDQTVYQEQCALPLGLVSEQKTQESVISWFAETVLKEIESDLVQYGHMSAEAAHRYISHGGFSVETTVDPDIQATLTQIFADETAVPIGEQMPSYAMCICDSQTGQLLAIVGRQGKKRANRLYNLASDVPHTPGSSLKPLALYAPLLNEKKIHAATVFDDVPLQFYQNGDTYTAYPRNSPNVYQGLMSVSDALRLSKNTVALRLYDMRGAESIFHSLRSDFDFDTVIRSAYADSGEHLTDLAPSPLALGQLTYGVTLRKMTEAYTVFPSEGVKHSGYSYCRVLDGQGKAILEKQIKEKRVYSEECARIMNQMLSGVTEDGTAKSITLKESIDTAGKTGTSGNDRDRWFVGYTPYYTAGIWCGYETTAQPIGQNGRSHLQLWDEVMTKVHARILEQKTEPNSFSTEGLVRCAFCKDSGERFTPTCAKDPRESRMGHAFFTSDNSPQTNCARHMLVPYDTLTGAVACEHCPKEDVVEVALVRMNERVFPCQVYVSDAQYAYRLLPDDIPPGEDTDCPYFIHMLQDGTYCGISIGKKQYNCACIFHSEDTAPEEEFFDGEEISSA